MQVKSQMWPVLAYNLSLAAGSVRHPVSKDRLANLLNFGMSFLRFSEIQG